MPDFHRSYRNYFKWAPAFACFAGLTAVLAAGTGAWARTTDNQTEDYRYQQAVALFNQRDWEGARQALHEFLKSFPRSRWLPAVNLRLADLETDPVRAEKAYKDIIREAGSTEWGQDARWALANHQYMLGRYAQAAEWFLTVGQSQDPRAPRALLLAGLCQQALKATRAAGNSFRRVYSEFADSPWAGAALLALGDLERDAKHEAEAVAAYDQYLKAYPQGELLSQVRERKASILKTAVPAAAGGSGPRAGAGGKETGRFTIQVGAFSKLEYAEQLVRKLTTLGYSASRLETRSHEEVFHQVRVGNYASREAAEKTAVQLESREKLPTFIMPLTPPGEVK